MSTDSLLTRHVAAWARAALALSLAAAAWFPALGADCNANGLDDACDLACGPSGGACDLPGCGGSSDCNANLVPDECDRRGVVRVGDRDDFDDADGDGDADLLAGQTVNYPGLGTGETAGSGESFTDVTVNIGTDYAYSFTLPPGFYTAAVLRIQAFDADATSGGWPTAVIDLDGSDWGFRITRVTLTSSFNPGYVGLDAFKLPPAALPALRDGSLTVTLRGAAASGSDGAVIDFVELEYELADCNGNGRLDSCDVASLASPDCNANGLPDECEAAGTLWVGDRDDFDNADGDGVPDLTTGGSTNYPGAGTGQTSGSGEWYTDVTITAGTDVAYALSGPRAVYQAATLRLLTFDVDGNPGGWAEAPILLDGADSGHRLTRVASTPSFNPGNVHQDAFPLAAGGLAALADGALAVVLQGSATSAGDGAVIDAVALDFTLADCNGNGVLDSCDAGGPSADCNADRIPDECQTDCNANGVPDDCDIAGGASIDCNGNGVPDECDLAGGSSTDCNADGRPDECAICPGVEVVFEMDTSTSMEDEGAALCSSIVEVTARLAADLIDVDADLLGISAAPGGIFACLTDTVIHVYGTAVPGSPPPGNQVLGDCPGGLEVAAEDWGRATSVVAGVRPWAPGSVRLVVPLSDEGAWCGDPVSDPGVDRDSITHAIQVSNAAGVIVSPISGSGSTAATIGLAQALANGTGGMQFTSTQAPGEIAAALEGIILDACMSMSDCNGNHRPDTCDLAGGSSQDCNANGRPDECETDCDGNAVPDDCDLAAGTWPDRNGNTVPDVCEMITLTVQPTTLSWTAVDCLGYDVVQGDLLPLHTSGGNFTTSTSSCLVSNQVATTLAYATQPAARSGFWLLVRAVGIGGNLSYDSFSTAQIGSRDAEIDAAATACP